MHLTTLTSPFEVCSNATMISSLAERPAPVATAKQKRSAKMSLRIRPSISRIEPRDIKDEGMRSRKWQIRHKGAAVLPRTENERSAAAPASGCARRDILGCRYSDIPRQKVEDVKLSLNSNPPPSRGHHSVLPFVLDVYRPVFHRVRAVRVLFLFIAAS